MDQDVMKQMDEAAEAAKKELKATWTAKQVAEWWKKWFMKAGHKRLGRILVAMAKSE